LQQSLYGIVCMREVLILGFGTQFVRIARTRVPTDTALATIPLRDCLHARGIELRD
jgi:hypothetical protein